MRKVVVAQHIAIDRISRVSILAGRYGQVAVSLIRCESLDQVRDFLEEIIHLLVMVGLLAKRLIKAGINEARVPVVDHLLDFLVINFHDHARVGCHTSLSLLFW